jgi:hypothetical protein
MHAYEGGGQGSIPLPSGLVFSPNLEEIIKDK